MKGQGMNLGIRYYLGAVNVMLHNPGDPVTNRSLYINVGIPIGAGKAKERREKETKP